MTAILVMATFGGGVQPIGPSLALGETLAEEWLRECVANVARLEDLGRSIRVRGHLEKTWVIPLHPEANRTLRSEIVYESNTRQTRLEERYLDGESPGVTEIYVSDPPYYFAVHENQRGEFLLDRLGGTETNVSQKIRGLGGLLVYHQPLGYASARPLSVLLTSPEFRLKRAARRTVDGRDLVRIEFEVLPCEDNHGLGLTGRLDFSVADSWALTSYECAYAKPLETSNMTLSGQIDYDGNVNGLPVPRTITQVEVYRPENTRLTRSFQIEEFAPTRFRDDHFTLAAFGLDDLAAPSSGNAPRTTWLLAVGGLSIVLAVVFRRASEHLRRRSS